MMKRTAFLLCALLFAFGGLNAQAQAPSTADSQPAGKSSVAGDTHRGSSRNDETLGADERHASRGKSEERTGSKGVVTTGGTGANEDQGNNH